MISIGAGLSATVRGLPPRIPVMMMGDEDSSATGASDAPGAVAAATVADLSLSPACAYGAMISAEPARRYARASPPIPLKNMQPPLKWKGAMFHRCRAY